MEGKAKIKFLEQKRRSIDQLAKDFGELSRSMFPSQELFMRIRKEVNLQEKIHGGVSKEFLKYEDNFWENYNVDKFCEAHNYSYQHLRRCKNGSRGYSRLLQEAIINWVKSGARNINTK